MHDPPLTGVGRCFKSWREPLYPATPMSLVLDTTLAKTGFPLASMLILASVLLLAGLFLLRTARYLAPTER